MAGQTYHRLQPRPDPALLSIVIPAYNEEQVLPKLRARMTSFLERLPCPAEVILVNDGSSDRTIDLLWDWATADPQVKVVGLARNFGHQIAVTAGLDVAAGQAIVIMDADLQDPPEVVLEMLAKYRDGYDVVYGQRSSRRGESAFKRFTAWLFYRLMRSLVHPGLPADTGDFRLISRACLDALRSMRETHRFLRGMVAWVGFPQAAVQFERSQRAAGETHYPFHKMLRFAWTAAVSFSSLPLRMSLVMGSLVAVFGLAVGVYAVLAKLLGYYTNDGWTSLVVLISIIGGATMISNGILGSYLGRVFEEAKGRPLYLVSTTANLAGPAAAVEANRGDLEMKGLVSASSPAGMSEAIGH